MEVVGLGGISEGRSDSVIEAIDKAVLIGNIIDGTHHTTRVAIHPLVVREYDLILIKEATVIKHGPRIPPPWTNFPLRGGEFYVNSQSCQHEVAMCWIHAQSWFIALASETLTPNIATIKWIGNNPAHIVYYYTAPVLFAVQGTGKRVQGGHDENLHQP